MLCGVESLGNVALNQDVRNQRQALGQVSVQKELVLVGRGHDP